MMIKNYFFRLMFIFWYFRKPPWDSGQTPPELIEFIAQHPPGKAIDLGCGTGTNVIALAQAGWQAEGIDFVPKAIRIGNMKAEQAGVEVRLQVGDVADTKYFNGPYDLILDMGCYHVLTEEQRKQYRQNIAQHLAPEGSFMLYGFTQKEESANTITEEDLQAFREFLILEERQDGDDHSQRSSAWFWFKAK